MKISKLLTMGIALGALANCGKGQSKPELADDLETTFDAVEAAGGRWSEVGVVESPHPYTNDLDRTFDVRGSAEAVELRLLFERFELEAGYDFLVVEGDDGAPQRWTGDRSGEEIVVSGNRARLRLVTDYSVTDFGFVARVFERHGCVCTTDVRPVCGADGNTYTNECNAGCAGVRVAYTGPCQDGAWVSVNRSIASPSPYPNDYVNTWTVREAGATSLRVHFASLDLERGYDFVRILDGDDRVVATYTGQQVDFHSAVVQGDTLKIEMRTDYSVTRGGFVVDYYQAAGGCRSDRECGTGMVCTQPQCVRAPCFAQCEPAPTAGYVDVTPADLRADPAAFDGQQVRVTDAPVVRALCTRRACSAADPCCNLCSGSFVIASSVTLRDANDQPYGCRGDECSWRSTCREFAPEGAGPYTFEGTVRVDGTGGVALLVDAFTAADCQVAGCSGQACANTPNVVTTCDFRPEYACYRQATCESQATGHCGWTQTPALLQCLANASSQRVVATDVPLAIPDDDAAGVQSRIDVLAGGPISEVEVTLEIRHTYRGDLIVDLVAPSGAVVSLHAGDGGSADDLVILDRALPELSGAPRGGAWTLRVRDRYAQDTGSLEGWSLTFR